MSVPASAAPKNRRFLTRWWVWATGIPMLFAATLSLVWIAGAPRQELPPGTIRLAAMPSKAVELTVSPGGKQVAWSIRSDGEKGEWRVQVMDLTSFIVETKQIPGGHPVWISANALAWHTGTKRTEPNRIVWQEGSDLQEVSIPGDGPIPDVLFDSASKTILVKETIRQPPLRHRIWRVDISAGKVFEEGGLSQFGDLEGISRDGTKWFFHSTSPPNRGLLMRGRDMKPLAPPLSIPLPYSNEISPSGSAIVKTQGHPTLQTHIAQSLTNTWEDLKFVPGEAKEAYRLIRSLDQDWNPKFGLYCLEVYEAATGDSTRIAAFREEGPGATWHPDGKHLIAQGDGHLWLIPLPQHLWSKPAPGYKGGE